MKECVMLYFPVLTHQTPKEVRRLSSSKSSVSPPEIYSLFLQRVYIHAQPEGVDGLDFETLRCILYSENSRERKSTESKLS